MFDAKVFGVIDHYVYVLKDPRPGRGIFYAGQGVGNRCFDHIEEAKSNKKKTEKLEIIREILGDDMEVEIDIVRHRMEKETALEVEAALIDALGLVGIGNRIRGRQGDRGLQSSRDIEIKYGAKPLVPEEPLLLIKITQQYKRGMTTDEVYGAVRWCWRMNINRASKVKYVLAVADGIVRGVFKPKKFKVVSGLEAVQSGNPKIEGRIYFDGNPVKNSPYADTSVRQWMGVGEQAPFRYIKEI